MSNKYDSYRNVYESKKALYQLLLDYVKKYKQKDVSLQGGYALLLIEKTIDMLQTESEESYKNAEWLEKKIDNQKEIIDSANIKIYYLQNMVISLAQKLDKVESIQKDIDKIKAEQEKTSKINKQLEDIVRKKSEAMSQQQKQNEKLQKDFLAIG